MSNESRPRVRGASGIRIGRKAHFQRWVSHHRDEAVIAVQRLIAAPLASLLTLLMLAVALALPGFSLTLLGNLERLAPSAQLEPQISLYLRTDLPVERVDSFSRELLLRDDLISVELIDSAAGAKEFRQHSELGSLLDYFDQNPLPAVILVLPKDRDPDVLEALKTDLLARDEVEFAEVDLRWIERLGAILRSFERISLILALLLGLTVLLVVANSIRMMINTRLEEIEVSLLIGATPAWVRRPFLYAGFWYGLVGAFLSLLMIYFALALAEAPLRELFTLYLGSFELQGPGINAWGWLLCGGALLGWGGAFIAVSLQLNQFNTLRD